MSDGMPVHRAVTRRGIDWLGRRLGHAVVIGENQCGSKRKKGPPPPLSRATRPCGKACCHKHSAPGHFSPPDRANPGDHHENRASYELGTLAAYELPTQRPTRVRGKRPATPGSPEENSRQPRLPTTKRCLGPNRSTRHTTKSYESTTEL